MQQQQTVPLIVIPHSFPNVVDFTKKNAYTPKLLLKYFSLNIVLKNTTTNEQNPTFNNRKSSQINENSLQTKCFKMSIRTIKWSIPKFISRKRNCNRQTKILQIFSPPAKFDHIINLHLWTVAWYGGGELWQRQQKIWREQGLLRIDGDKENRWSWGKSRVAFTFTFDSKS